MLASMDLMEHISDHPWPGWQVEVFGMRVTLMSSGISAMIVVGLGLIAVLVPVARRYRTKRGVPQYALEALVVFVRDNIARPALHEKAYTYLPLLLTIFVFILGMNLLGIVPLEPISVGLGLPPIGATATSILTVCAAMASVTLFLLVGKGIGKAIRRARSRHPSWPGPLCLVLAPVLWFLGLSPHIEGAVGKALLLPMAVLELVGLLAKCFSLMVRLCANMLSGHALLAVLMIFILQTLSGFLQEGTAHLFYVGPACVLGSVMVDLLELMVAGLQAYVFTFLTAVFLSLYVEAEH